MKGDGYWDGYWDSIEELGQPLWESILAAEGDGDMLYDGARVIWNAL